MKPRLLLHAALLLGLAGDALARVEVQASAGTLLAAKVSEEIGPGDYEALLRGLRAHPGAFARRIVLLDSLGGSAPEAMRMGRLLRETGFEAVVPVGGLCQGSCLYLLAAGKRRTVNGAVAIHRPAFAAGDSAQSQAAHGRERYDAAGYLREMGLAPALARDLQATPPQRPRLLGSDDLKRYRLLD